MSEASESQLQEIYENAGRPGTQAKFRFAVKKSGYSISDKDAKNLCPRKVLDKFFAEGRACQVMAKFQAEDLICDSSLICLIFQKNL